MLRMLRVLPFLLVLWASSVLAQGNGRLQLHFMDVGQGDAALLISPGGQTVLFDDGTNGECDKPVSYLQQLGVTRLDYLVASHYHADHIGCTMEVLHECPVREAVYDRGASYKGNTYDRYVAAVGSHRKAATDQTVITLDPNTSHPVRIEIVALAGC
jgi:competence protein ComEC